jgi:hypothetical protein
MKDRQRLGLGLLGVTAAAVPVVFFLVVANNVVLAVAAVVVELGLFIASRIALSRPMKPVGAARFEPPRQR